MPSENYCDFTIFITEKDGKKGLVVEATSMDTEISFNTILVSDDVNAQKRLHRFERQIKGYAGPDFSTLDERIQGALNEYLESFGVNEHLAAFVECMSLDKDQRLYMSWLSNLKDFVNQ
jgi:complement component 1 Q subcomponent-binding protein